MAELREPGWGFVGWEFTDEEYRRGHVQHVSIHCSVEDEQQFMELVQSYDTGALVHVANYYFSRQIQLDREHLKNFLIPVCREVVAGGHRPDCPCLGCTNPSWVRCITNLCDRGEQT